MTCNGMAFFQANFMLQTPHNDEDHDHNHHHHHHHHHQPSLNSLNNPILPSCSPQDFHGVASLLGKRSSMSFSGIDMCNDQETNGGEDELLSEDDGSQVGEKKRRLNMEQVKTLEKNFELGNKLEPERKMQLARALGLQPRQIAIWFQNRRARWKTKQLEKDYDLLKRQFDSIKADNEALQSQNQKLHAEIMALKKREIPTGSINLNKETEGSCSNRSDDNSSELIKFDISTTTPPIESPPQPHNPPITMTSRPLFPSRPTAGGGGGGGGGVGVGVGVGMAHHLFQNSAATRPTDHFHHHHLSTTSTTNVKEESFSNMFCGIEDQSGFWPWLEQQHFN